MKSIILVGAGQLGSRHLQALALLDSPYKIFVCDPSLASLEMSKTRYEEVYSNTEHQISYFSCLKEITETVIDFVVIATNASLRYRVYKDVVSKFQVKNLIFEKVLFQQLEHYQAVSKDLKERGINAWVNCPFRMYPFYQHIKSRFLKCDQPIYLSYSGGEWVGLGCNTIHYIDVLNFLSGEKLTAVSTANLDKSIVESKRKGFIEFTGTLKCTFEAGSVLDISAIRGSGQGVKLEIKQNENAIVMDELTGEYRVLNGEVTIENGVLQMPFQSNLTNKLIQEIAHTQSCQLPLYDLSKSLHIPFIEALLGFQNEVQGSEDVNLKIT